MRYQPINFAKKFALIDAQWQPKVGSAAVADRPRT